MEAGPTFFGYATDPRRGCDHVSSRMMFANVSWTSQEPLEGAGYQPSSVEKPVSESERPSGQKKNQNQSNDSLDDLTQIELLKGLMTLPIEGLKMICLINGGAAIAVLTYFGNSLPQSGSLAPDFAPQLIASVKWYCAGLACAACDLVLAYFVLLTRSVRRGRRSRSFSWRLHRSLIVLGSAAAILSVAFFIVGSITAANAFSVFQAR